MTETLLKDRLNWCRRRISSLKKHMRKQPDGSLVINSRDDGTFFYQDVHGKREGISKDTERIYALARKRYRQELLDFYNSEVHVMEFMHSILVNLKRKNQIPFLEKKYLDAGLDLMQIRYSSAQLQGIGKQSENPFKREYLKWKSDGGIYVRSKSERDFCNRLEKYHVPFQYEREIVLDMTGMEDAKGVRYYNGCPHKSVYPDFTIFLADGSLLFIEHLGRVDLEEYRKGTGEKIIILLASGAVDRDHLLITFEEDMQNPDVIDQFIAEWILPRI